MGHKSWTTQLNSHTRKRNSFNWEVSMKNDSYIITTTENKIFWQVDFTKIATAIDLSDRVLGGHVTYGTF